jgi:methylamine---glutamate N-methyltransferase subunit A
VLGSQSSNGHIFLCRMAKATINRSTPSCSSAARLLVCPIMCGIVGFMNKSGSRSESLGATLIAMLRALACRGPDSAGVAIYNLPADGWVLQVKLPERDDIEACSSVRAAAARFARVLDARTTGPYLRLVVEQVEDPVQLQQIIESVAAGVEVISLGRRLEILKQVGSPDELDKTYDISAMDGSHGIGHTRLSTESRVDLSHSQPFWAHGLPDLATVHNGHITNYHKMRRRYEQRGVRFYTENDSEIIGIYLRDQLARGQSLQQALRQSLDDFDGSFSYLAATTDAIAFVKDRFGFKPLMVADTDDFVAIATEEIALRRVFPGTYRTTEPPPGSMRVWPIANSTAGRRLYNSSTVQSVP